MRGPVAWAAGALALIAAAAPGPATAHPHVLIDSHLVFLFKAGKITGIQMGWKFDPVYSGTLVADFDEDKNGELSPAEIATMEKEAFADTAKFDYFTHARVDGARITWPKAAAFQIFVQKDSLVYAFRLDFPEPVDPRKQRLEVSTFEETYYIDIDIPNDAAVRLIGDGSQGCATTIGPDRDNALFGGIVFPKKVEVSCPTR